MLQKIVILGSHFICDKRICNIVQKVVTMDEKEVENYLHLHKFFKDQRAIVIDASVNACNGYIFTGESFVNPITMQTYSIDGEVDEEEIDTSSPTELDEDVIEKVLTRVLDPVVKRLDAYLELPGPSYEKFDKVKKYKVVCGSVHIRRGPAAHFPSDDFVRRDSVVQVYGIVKPTNFGYLGNGRWITLNDNYLQEVKR